MEYSSWRPGVKLNTAVGNQGLEADEVSTAKDNSKIKRLGSEKGAQKILRRQARMRIRIHIQTRRHNRIISTKQLSCTAWIPKQVLDSIMKQI